MSKRTSSNSKSKARKPAAEVPPVPKAEGEKAKVARLVDGEPQLRLLEPKEVKAGVGINSRVGANAYSEERVGDMADSIKRQGQLTPITVAMVRDGDATSYVCLAGNTRLKACELLGVQVRAEVVGGDKPIDLPTARVLSLVENVERDSISTYETAVSVHRLHYQDGLSHQQIATQVKRIGKAQIGHLCRIVENAHPDILAAWDLGEEGVSQDWIMRAMAQPKGEQLAWLERLRAGEPMPGDEGDDDDGEGEGEGGKGDKAKGPKRREIKKALALLEKDSDAAAVCRWVLGINPTLTIDGVTYWPPADAE